MGFSNKHQPFPQNAIRQIPAIHQRKTIPYRRPRRRGAPRGDLDPATVTALTGRGLRCDGIQRRGIGGIMVGFGMPARLFWWADRRVQGGHDGLLYLAIGGRHANGRSRVHTVPFMLLYRGGFDEGAAAYVCPLSHSHRAFLPTSWAARFSLHLLHLDQRAGVMARTFGTCEGDTRDRMVRTSSGDGAGIAASSRLRAAVILRW